MDTQQTQQELIAWNAAVIAVAALASFVLPRIAASMTDGRANFLIAMAQVVPVLSAIPVSCGFVKKAIAMK